jgi:hypothetical protein
VYRFLFSIYKMVPQCIYGLIILVIVLGATYYLVKSKFSPEVEGFAIPEAVDPKIGLGMKDIIKFEKENEPPESPEMEKDTYSFRDPMTKSCTNRNPSQWPLSYREPYFDPLFDMKLTGLYSALNSDPANLVEVRQWQYVL